MFTKGTSYICVTFNIVFRSDLWIFCLCIIHMQRESSVLLDFWLGHTASFSVCPNPVLVSTLFSCFVIFWEHIEFSFRAQWGSIFRLFMFVTNDTSIWLLIIMWHIILICCYFQCFDVFWLSNSTCFLNFSGIVFFGF